MTLLTYKSLSLQKRGILILVTSFFLGSLSASETARDWTVPGRPPVKAILISKTPEAVVLRTADGKDHQVAISRLSQPDQDYIAKADLTNLSASTPGSPPASAPTQNSDSKFADWRTGQPLNPAHLQLLDDAIDQAFAQKSWAPYEEVLEDGTRYILGDLRPDLGIDNYLRVLAEPSIYKMFVFDRFLSKISEDQLKRMIEAPEEWEPFLRWLLANPTIAEDFMTAIHPKDDPAEVFAIWKNLWEEIPETQAKFANVGMACALVFDRPITVKRVGSQPKQQVDPVERCRDYILASRGGQLKTQIEDMLVHELTWVVSANVSAEDLTWARSKIRLSQENWGKSYAMIEYLMERATDDANPYETYMLEEILEVGGVCRDQAHFAANTARANGIPAYVVSGDGDRGPHAWLGYKVGRGEWSSRTGRYPGYRTGTTRSPQTGQPVREQMFHLWNEANYLDLDSYRTGHRLVWLSEIYGEMEHQEGELTLARFAFTRGEHLPRTMDQLIAALQDYPQATEAHWKSVITGIRRAYREHPDILARAAALEREHIPLEGNEEELIANIASERRAIQRKDGERSDIVVMLYQREADISARQDNLDAVMDIYKKAYRDLAGDIPAFKQLSRDLVAFTESNEAMKEEALDLIEKHYEKDVVSGSDEYFRLESEKSVRKLIDKLKGEA